METQIISVRQLAEKHPGFSEAALRWHIFKARENGLLAAGAIVRVRRRVLIDESRFLDWLKNQQAHAA